MSSPPKHGGKKAAAKASPGGSPNASPSASPQLGLSAINSAGHARKISAFGSKAGIPNVPALSAEQVALQAVPRDAAMLELLPRGDVFAAHKLAAAAETLEEVPLHVQDKLALFEQSFSVLKFPHKTYSTVVLDPPAFKETFHTDTIVVPSPSVNSGSGTAGPASALVRSSKQLDLMPSVDDTPSKLKSVTVADVFDSLGVEEHTGGRTRSTGEHSSQPPLPEGYSGSASGSNSAAAMAAGSQPVKTLSFADEPSAKSSSAPPAKSPTPPPTDSAVVLRSYFPSYNWSEGAEVALCERQPLPPPMRASVPSIRFLFQAKSLQLDLFKPPHGREIEPLFCELALYNVAPEGRGKLTDTFSVQLSNHQVVDMLQKARTAKASKNGGDAASASSKSTASPFIPFGYVNSTSCSPCTRALFSLPLSAASTSSARASVAVVLLVYKVLQGKLDSVLDAYTQGAEKEKYVKKAGDLAAEAAKRWGEHRQLMMWSAAPLFTDGGALAPVAFTELYRPPKTEEAFTMESLTDAAATLLQGVSSSSKKRNPSGYKVIPGSFVCSVTPLPGPRALAIAEVERLTASPVYNANMVPAKMEEVVESPEAICVGHEMLAAQNNMAAGGTATNGDSSLSPPTGAGEKRGSASGDGMSTPPRKSPSPVEVDKAFKPIGAHARDQSIHKLLDHSLSSFSSLDPFTQSPTAKPVDLSAEQQAKLEKMRQSPVHATSAQEQAATVAAEEWVAVDQTGALVRKSSALTVSVTSPDNTTSPIGSSSPAPVSSPVPMSPSSRALIKLDHGRQRSYVLPPNGEAMSAAGFVLEVDPVPDLALHAAVASNAASGSNSPSSSTSLSRESSGSNGSNTLALPNAAAAIAMSDESHSPFHMHYTNHLYVYPQSIKFDDARNVCISIQIKDTHESATEPALELIYPRADELLNGKTRPVGSFVSQTFTAATYHCHNANFVDEIKIELPLVLKPTHHLLFTFFNISCKDSIVVSKDGSGDDRTLLGYAMLPLYLDNRIVDEGYTLPVCAKLKPHYLLQKDEWDGRRQALFTVKLRVDSSLYTNDPFLNRFFLKCVVPRAASAAASDDSSASLTKRKDTSASSNSGDDMLSLMLRKVLRSGQLKKKGGLKWTDRWWSLSDSTLIVHKSARDPKVWHHTPITARTNTLRSGSSKPDDELRFAWTIRADGIPEQLSEVPTLAVLPENSSSSGGVLSPEPGDLLSPLSALSASSVTSGPAAGASAATAAVRASVASPPPASASASPPAGPQASPSAPVAMPGLDAESYEAEMALQAESEDEMFSWLKAIAHAKIAKWSILDSVRGVREAQGELLVKHLPMIMRQLVSVICWPEGGSTATDDPATPLDKLKSAAFETMLEVAALVEQGTPSSTEKQRNIHLDAWCQYIFDDNSSALPLPLLGPPREAAQIKSPEVKSPAPEVKPTETKPADVKLADAKPDVKPAEDETVAASVATATPAAVSLHLGPGDPAATAAKVETVEAAHAAATTAPAAAPTPATVVVAESKENKDEKPASAPADSAASTPAPAVARPVSAPVKQSRVRSYEAIATLWLQLLKSGGGSSSSASSVAGSTTPGGSSSRSLAPLREHAARFSWLLLDMLSKSLLLSTAGARERRVSMALPTSPFGATISPKPASSSNFFKPSSIKLMTDLVSALTHEIFFLASISLSLSKTLNKNLALFLRDAFYIFPRSVVFDWIALYLQISFKLEPSRSHSGSGSSGGSSSRFKYTFMQILADHEHFVSYNVRVAPFVGEAKKYLQTNEFGEWQMGDYLNQPFNDKAPKDDPVSSTDPRSSPVHEKTASISMSASSRGHTSTLSVDESGLGVKQQRSNSELDQLSPMRAEMRREMSAPSGHFFPFLLIKQVWLAFRQNAAPAASSSPSPPASTSTVSIAQEQALSLAAYTLRSVLTKHELDARYQGQKKRSIVASMYVRLLPCLWSNLDQLKAMRIVLPKQEAAPNSSETKPAPAGSIASSNARKDLIACALFVLNNLTSTELLRYLRESDYRIHPSNVKDWYFKFIELLSIVLETVEYAGPMMRRLESLVSAGGAMSQLGTTLCARMMVPLGGELMSDWNGAEEIAGARLGAAGGLAALENKYTRNRTNTQLQGHRKSVNAATAGTMKRRDDKVSFNLQAEARSRARQANRTLNSRTGALLDGGDAQFQAITGIDPAIQRWEKLYAHEASGIVLHILTHVVLPMSEDALIGAADMQDRLLWFLHGFLRLNQSDQMLVQWFSLLSNLLTQHAALVWPLSTKSLDPKRCSAWWFELLRHLSFHRAETREAASAFIYQLFLSVSNAIGSTNRVAIPLIRAFPRVLDALRNRKTELGQGSTAGAQWTVLQLPAVGSPPNDAAYIGVLSALAKSATALAQRASNDPRRNDSVTVAAIQDVQTSFTLLQKIIDLSAIIHSVKANSLDPDALIERTHDMARLYKRAPRMRLLYFKHMYDLHLASGNTAEAGETQLKMFRIIHREAMRATAENRFSTLEQPLWNSDHATACLRKASELFEAAELYEQALQAENHSIAHWVVRKNPALVVPHAKRLVVLWEKLASLATLGDTRSFGTFYRVGFHGQPFASFGMDGHEFVYREPNLTKLPEITSRLVSLWTGILGREVTVFKDSGVIDRSALGDAAKLQVTAVLPFFESDSLEAAPEAHSASLVHPPTAFELTASHLRDRATHFEKHTALSKFYYDTPYTQGGKSHGTVETQFKKRSLVSLSPSDSFPSYLRRLPVASRTEIDMTPIECVLEDVHKRIHKLVSEARPALGNPDLKTLTQVLSGSVNVQVNGGTAEVCQVFLSPDNRSKWDQKDLEELRRALGVFVTASGEALEVAKRLASEDATNASAAFIEVLDQGYAALIASVRLAVPDLDI